MWNLLAGCQLRSERVSSARCTIRSSDCSTIGFIALLLTQHTNKLNKAGELVVTSTKTRSQKKNVEDAIAKLQEVG